MPKQGKKVNWDRFDLQSRAMLTRVRTSLILLKTRSQACGDELATEELASALRHVDACRGNITRYKDPEYL